jgi:hypothetical protein
MIFRRSTIAAANQPVFGLQIEDMTLQLVIASVLPDGRYSLAFEKVDCPSELGYLSEAGIASLVETLRRWCETYQINRGRIAVSLDGDFCVTRVIAGSADEVQRELGMLAHRVPRYLQLGAGKKVTGGMQTELEPGIFYAATGVVNREVIELLYSALCEFDLDIAWVEPSLNSLARLIGLDPRYQDQPVLIADGTGRRWDVGIANGGRLLLDYRPPNSDTIDGLFGALDGHLQRLRRFCQRHRKLTSGNIENLLVCGKDGYVEEAIAKLARLDGIRTVELTVPDLTALVEFKAEVQDDKVFAIAAVLPLLMKIPSDQVPDLLHQVRRAPKATKFERLMSVGIPIAAASLMLMVALAWRGIESHRYQAAASSRDTLESELSVTQVQFAKLASQRRHSLNLDRIAMWTQTRPWDQVSTQLTQCLSPSTKFNSWVASEGNRVVIQGETTEDASLYDLISALRRVPDVTEVALKGTTPMEGSIGSRFVLEIGMQSLQVEAENVVEGEAESGNPEEWEAAP